VRMKQSDNPRLIHTLSERLTPVNSQIPAQAGHVFNPIWCMQILARQLANDLPGVSPDWVMALVPVSS